MSQTPICKDTAIWGAVFPIKIAHSALLESGYSSTGPVATDCTMALGFKPTAATTTPLIDMTSHYLLTIQKQGSTVRVWKQGVELADYTGSVGATYAEFLSNVLTAYSGNNKGYYSRLAIAESVLVYSDFWEPADIVTGLWRPKSIAGLSLHTLLDFSNAVDLGNDTSGNGNHWTMASGTASADTPTNNYATLNPHSTSYLAALKGGNLLMDDPSGAGQPTPTMYPKTGKWYIEVGLEALDTINAPFLGLVPEWRDVQYNYPGADSASWGLALTQASQGNSVVIKHNGATAATVNFSRGCNVSDVYGIALDLDAGKLWLRHPVDGWFGDPAAETGELMSGFPATVMPTAWGQMDARFNFGATGFTYTAPAGFKSLCQANRPNPTVLKSSTGADVVLRQGNTQAFTGGTATAQHTREGSPAQGFNPANVTYPTYTWMSNAYNDGWLRYDFGEGNGKVLTDFIVQIGSAGPTLYASHAPKNFTIQASHDGNTWDTLVTQTGVVWSYEGQKKVYPTNNTTSYRFYQIDSTLAADGGNYIVIGCFWGLEESKIVLPDMEGGPDFVDIKARNSVSSWGVQDKLRGSNKVVWTDSTSAEGTSDQFATFTADGYSLGTDSTVNAAGYNYLDLCLKADALTELDASNNVVSQTLNGTSFGLEIIKVTGDGVAGRQIPLVGFNGQAPAVILAKCLNAASNWTMYHNALGATKSLELENPNAAGTNVNRWNNTEPTATNITVGTSANVNGAAKTYIFYVFYDSALYKAFSYTIGDTATPAFVNLGGKPLMVMNKYAVGAGDQHWFISTSTQNPMNGVNKVLIPNEASAEAIRGAGDHDYLFTSQGFKTNYAIHHYANTTYAGFAILESTKHNNAY